MKSVNLKNQGPAEFVIHVQSDSKYGTIIHLMAIITIIGFTSLDVSFNAFNCLYSGSLTRDDDKAN